MSTTLKRITNSYLFFLIIATALIFPFIIADFNSYPISDLKDLLYTASQCFMVYSASFAIIGLLSLNKYIFSITYPILVLICSILAYYAITTNTTFTVMILDATLHNDLRTSADLISPFLILTVIVSLTLSLLLVYYRFNKIKRIKYKIVHLVTSLFLIVLVLNISKIRQVLYNHIPYNIYYVTTKYLSERKVAAEYRESLSAGSYYKADNLTVVLVIGESLRADHLGINGYTRNTTPQLSKEKNLISYPYIHTNKTYTNISVPYIMTRADSLNEDIAYKERSFIDLFKACDFQTAWLANQESADSYIYFMKECDTLVFATINKSSYTFDKWLDESLIPHYDYQIAIDNKRKLIILHTIGSHWWYNSHYTDDYKKFQPTADSKIISSNTKEELINSYDNTILYTDNFLSSLIQPLKSKNAFFIYLADHGESLGENNIWLHASDSPPIHNPACLVWISDIYKQKYPEKHSALQENSSKKHMADFLFHSILDGAFITSPIVDKDQSIFYLK